MVILKTLFRMVRYISWTDPLLCTLIESGLNEPHREKNGISPMRKQRRRSASQ